MSFRVSTKAANGLRWLGFWLCTSAVALSMPVAVRAEPSIASLLREPPQASDRDPTEALARLFEALAQRPFAHGAEVQAALAEVKRELALLEAMYARAAPAAALKRHEQIVWAGLSWVDRLEARAALATHVAALRAQAERAESAALQASGRKPGP
jgi:hypothetical protein